VIVVESLEHFDVGKYEDVVDMAVTWIVADLMGENWGNKNLN
jgi:hypothetical protein